jgi:phenylpropionate dioxygenase-like ring-hydroxylating dioxygenase large terminal subunit
MGQDNRNVVEKIRADLKDLQNTDQQDARAMPGAFYTSEAFLDYEREHLFHKEWVCLGHVHEISKPGDFFTTDLAGEPLIVLRDQDGAIRVLSNVCRHRGNLVEADKTGNRKRFVCGYHAWTYGQDGALKAAPLMKKQRGFDQKKCGLKSFKVELWENFIFVNLNGQAAPLAPRMQALSGLMTNYHQHERHLVFSEETVWTTNWKSLMENFLEGYHLSATHLKTLHPITPTRLCQKFETTGDGFTGYRSFYDPEWPDRGPYHEDLTEDERRQTLITCAFPNLLLSVATHFTLHLCLRPVDADHVAIRWGIAGFNPDPDSREAKSYVDLVNAFNAEDRAKLETLTRGIKSKYYEPGPLAGDDYEGTIWDFLQYIAGRLV